MAEPEKPQAYSLPSFKIEEIERTLENKGKIYAHLIRVVDTNNHSFTLRERTNIEVENLIDSPVECVVEIVKATFMPPPVDSKEEEKLPKEVIKGTFVGWETGYKFFPELVSMVDGETGDADDEYFDEDEYDELATKLFSEWGANGFGLDVYRDKPMIKTDQGTFFLNEYLFEEQIDEWEQKLIPDIEVYFTIEELLLHGIKKYEGEWELKSDSKQNHHSFIFDEPLKPSEMLIRGRPKILK